MIIYEHVTKSFWTGRLERELQMIQLSATRCSCIATLWVSLVSFAAITFCVPTQWVFIVFISLSTQSGNFWIRPRIIMVTKSRKMRWTGYVARMGEMINIYKILVGKSEWKRPVWRPRRRWEDNIRMDLRETGLQYVGGIHLAQDSDQWRTVVNTVTNFRVPLKAENFFTNRVTVSFWRRTLHRGDSYLAS
jgi:hypothetical protein